MDSMQVIAFEIEEFEQIHKMRLWLHNKQSSMTFDEQRDFAERLRLLLERGQRIGLPPYHLTDRDQLVMKRALKRSTRLVADGKE